MTVTYRSVKLQQFHSSTLNSQTYLIGEIFYDTDRKSLRVFDGQTFGGYELARADLANISKTIGAAISDTPPTSTQSGTIWLNTSNEKLYIYNSSAWVQPQFPAYGGGAGGGGVSTANIGVSATSPTSVIGNAWLDTQTGDFLVNNGSTWFQPSVGGTAGSPNISFPSSPSVNQVYTYGTKVWKWNGLYWEFQTTSAGVGTIVSGGPGTLAWYQNSGTTLVTTDGGLTFDGSNLVATGSITASSFVGNATSSSKLNTARAINGVAFDGTADINFPVGSGTVNTGTIYTLAQYRTSTNAVHPTTNLTWDDTNGNLVISGTIVATGASSQVRFYWPNISTIQSTLSASAYSGAIGYAAAQGRLYVATGSTWSALANYSDIPQTFKTVSVSGQSNVVATAITDTLNLVAGTNIAITTNPGSNSVTITGTAGSAYSINSGVASRLSYYATSGQALSDTGSNLTWDGTSLLTVAGTVNTTSLVVNSSTTLQQIFEKATVDGSTIVNGALNVDAATSAIVYYTQAQSNSFSFNIRGNSGTTLNTLMAVGKTLSLTIMITTTATPGSLTAITVDGNTDGSSGYSITLKYPKGVTILSTGNQSSIDIYSLTLFKTADKTFTIIAQRVNYS